MRSVAASTPVRAVTSRIVRPSPLRRAAASSARGPCCRPRRTRLLAVPSGTPAAAAISRAVRPLPNASSTASRWSPGSASSAPSTRRLLSRRITGSAASSATAAGHADLAPCGGRRRPRAPARAPAVERAAAGHHRQVAAQRARGGRRTSSGLRHRCMNTSCTTSSAAAVSRSTRLAATMPAGMLAVRAVELAGSLRSVHGLPLCCGFLKQGVEDHIVLWRKTSTAC